MVPVVVQVAVPSPVELVVKASEAWSQPLSVNLMTVPAGMSTRVARVTVSVSAFQPSTTMSPAFSVLSTWS